MPQVTPVVAAQIFLFAISAMGAAYQYQRASRGNQSPAGKDPALGGQQVNTRSSRQPLPIIYGQYMTGVNKTFLHVKNPYLYMICELGEGEIDGIVREDGTVYTTTGSDLPAGNPPLVYLDDELFTKYGDVVKIQFFSGSSSQSVCSSLQGEVSRWDQTLRHTAYLYIRLKYDVDKTNVEPEVKATVRGVKIYNPIATVTEYTNNPALCTYDYLTRSSARGGIGIAASRIDTASLSSAIDYCTAKGWTCNMPISQNQAVADNLGRILANYRGDVLQSADKIKIKFKDLNYESVVMSLSDSDVIRGADGFSSLEITQPDVGRRPNAIRAIHLSAEKKYKPDDVITSDATAITAEGDLREKKIELFGLSELELVQKMSNYHLERERLNKTVSFVAGSRAIALEPMDLVNFDHTMPGWDDQVLRVESCPINGDHTVSLTLIEEADTFYDDIYNLTAHDFDSTDLPGPFDAVPSVVNVSHSEEVYYYRNRSFTRWKIDFDAPAAADYPWWDYAEIWLKIGSGEWRYMTRCDTNYQVDPVEEGETYYVKVRSVSIFGAKEDFDNCTQLSQTIVGVTSAPSSLTSIMTIANGDSVSIYGTPLTDPDIEGYEIRLGDTWDGGIFVSFNKNISLRLNGVRPGTHKFWAAAKDNKGNYSASPVSATVTVFVPPGFSELATYGSWAWDFSAGTFDNTEQVTYDSEDSLKCSHTSDVLTGTWTSPTHDLSALEKVRVWGDFRVAFESSDTTWDGVFPLTTTGSELITDGAFDNWTSDDLDDWTEGANCDAAEDVAGDTGSAAKLTLSGDNSGIYQDITVTADTWYILRGRYKNTAGDTAKIFVVDRTALKYITPEHGFDLADSTTFDDFNYLFKTPAGCTTVRIWLAAAANGDIVWYDTVSLLKVDEANSVTWADVDSGATKTWQEIFAQTSAAQLQATLRHKVLSGDSWKEIDFFELLCAEVEARYLSVVVTITDPSLDANLYLKELNMLAYEGPQ